MLGPDLVKIDVEGYECTVLSALSSYIQVNRPTVFLEIHPDMMEKQGDSPEKLGALISALHMESSMPMEDMVSERQHSRIVLT
jgi:hypothetical protein